MAHQLYNSIHIRLKKHAIDICSLLLDNMNVDGIQEEEWGLIAYFKQNKINEDFQISLDKIRAIAESIEIQEVPNENWNQLWESNYDIAIINERTIIKAPFHKKNFQHIYQIIINPQMAFGTGHHETTHMLLDILSSMELKDLKIADIGCGTGVLSILAHLKQAKEIIGSDYDPLCQTSFHENMQLNNITNIPFFLSDVTNPSFLENFKKNSYDIVLANINRNIILNGIHNLEAICARKSCILSSGYYLKDVAIIETAMSKFGLENAETFMRGNWCANRFVRA